MSWFMRESHHNYPLDSELDFNCELNFCHMSQMWGPHHKYPSKYSLWINNFDSKNEFFWSSTSILIQYIWPRCSWKNKMQLHPPSLSLFQFSTHKSQPSFSLFTSFILCQKRNPKITLLTFRCNYQTNSNSSLFISFLRKTSTCH